MRSFLVDTLFMSICLSIFCISFILLLSLFAKSPIPLNFEIPFVSAAITNNIGNFENKDIDSGKFRRLNFFIEPFLFSETSIVHRFEDNPEGMIFPRELIIYEKITLEEHITNFIKNYN